MTECHKYIFNTLTDYLYEKTAQSLSAKFIQASVVYLGFGENSHEKKFWYLKVEVATSSEVGEGREHFHLKPMLCLAQYQ